MTQVFVVEEAERKPIKTGKRAGEHFLRVKVPGMGWATIFGTGDANLVLNNEGATFKGEVDEDDYGKKLSKLEIVDGERASDSSISSPVKSSSLSKEEWAQKDSEDWLRRLYISHLNNLVALSAPEIGTLTYDKFRKDARMYATQDLLWIRGGGTDVSF